MPGPALEDELREELRRLEDDGLLRRRRMLEGPQGVRVVVDGLPCLAFASNDYLGLANHPAIIAAAIAGAGTFGVGAGASHLITGHGSAHHALETELARFVDLPAALLFSTGYMANIGTVSALCARGDAIFSDALNHASLIDAARLSRADIHRYPHLDIGALDAALAACRARRKLVISDAVFSMDGDIAPVPALLALCERHDACLLLDDAHGFGVLGAGGRGILEHFSMRSPRVIYMATLGKAAGVAGAFVAGTTELIRVLIQRARTYIYTTAMPPLLAYALSASLTIIAGDGWRRRHLQRLIAQLKSGFDAKAWRLLPSDTPIQPLMLGSNRSALRVSAALSERGILIPAIRPPTVPEGSARLRISLSAAHSEADVSELISALREVAAHDEDAPATPAKRNAG
ncbi:MAG: 8-amino-7-oxononanoate synthase [Pseudomonadota bacterium]|nr:8-amino-7-oxononanoate synthase [Pseudomonadota bacterium]